jgi:DNA-binding transcriptional ArsR family regulator
MVHISIYSYRGIVDFLGIMTEATVESIFGTKAGIVWKALNKNGPSNIDSIAKATGLRRELVYSALGWLGRENKIIMERRGRAMIFSLREEELQKEAVRETAIDDSDIDDSKPEEVKKALAFILSEFEANGEPTPLQVSKAAGMDSRQLGKALSKLGIRSKPVRRGGKNFRIYPLALKARVQELANT